MLRCSKQKIEHILSRPFIPEYGIPESGGGMLPWSYICIFYVYVLEDPEG